MHPIICQIGPVTIYSYATIMTVAIIFVSVLVLREIRLLGMDPGFSLKLVLILVLAALIGARLLSVATHWEQFSNNWIGIFNFNLTGLATHGGLILATLVCWLVTKSHPLGTKKILDLVPYFVLGLAIIRVGCFMNGCCYGKPVSWGIYSPAQNDFLHPTQLYYLAGYLIIFCILKRFQSKNKIAGRVFVLYIILEMILRIIVGFFLAQSTASLGPLSSMQIVYFFIMLFSIYAYTYLTSRSRF